MHHGAYRTGIDRHAHGRDVRSRSIGIEYHIEEVGAGSRRLERDRIHIADIYGIKHHGSGAVWRHGRLVPYLNFTILAREITYVFEFHCMDNATVFVKPANVAFRILTRY